MNEPATKTTGFHLWKYALKVQDITVDEDERQHTTPLYGVQRYQRGICFYCNADKSAEGRALW